MLKSFRVINVEAPTKHSEEYMEIYKKMENFHSPLWSIEILLFLLLASTWLLGCTSAYPVVSVLAFAFTQILVGWVGHSAAHSRNKKVNFLGTL